MVLGLARSGEAAALALRDRGREVIGVDAGDPLSNPGLAQAGRRLQDAGVEVRLDATGERLQQGIRTLVKSPGVPQSDPLVQAARHAGIPVLGELELAWRLLPNEFIAVTGTNGKTTTTEWIGHIHRRADTQVAVAGNVGTALSTLIGAVTSQTTIVCEASSFQLEDTIGFRPDLGVLLNVTPDHLDRHGTFENYLHAKLRIFDRQGPDDVAVLPGDFGASIGGEARQVRFGDDPSCELRLAGGELRWRGEKLVAAEEIGIPGEHNLQNAMAAAGACLARGLDRDAVADGLRTFTGVPHRLELVAECSGVRYVNDSKATNVASTTVALRAYPHGVRLILGGRGKGQDFSSLAPLLAERCPAVYLIGEDAALIESAVQGTGVRLHRSGTLGSALVQAAGDARPGEVVLLSPACASFDQFRDFEARGDEFRRLVHELAGIRGHG